MLPLVDDDNVLMFPRHKSRLDSNFSITSIPGSSNLRSFTIRLLRLDSMGAVVRCAADADATSASVFPGVEEFVG